MKKILLAAFAVLSLGLFAQAQTAGTTQKPALTSEQKAKLKAQNEQDLAASFTAVGLSAEQVKQVREALDAATAKNEELKDNATLTDEAKAEAKKKISESKNNALQEIMGKEKYSHWVALRKQQKEKAAGN